MSKPPILPWKRLITEGAVIVASILLAFAIDAWWDEHKKNDDILEILTLVEFETKTNLTNLAISIASHEEILKAIRVAHDEQSIANVIGDAVIDVEVFEPTSDALRTLVATGMLGSIDDVDLRIALITFDGLARDLMEREIAAASFRDSARRRIASLGVRIYEDTTTSSQIFADVEVLNLLAMRATEEMDAIESGQKLEAHLQKIVVRLDALNRR